MSLYKREGSEYWWASYTDGSGKRVRESTGTSDRRKAQEYHDRVKARGWDAKLSGNAKHTWEEAATRWLEEMSHKATIHEDAAKIVWLTKHLSRMDLDEIRTSVVKRVAEIKRSESSGATANRYTALLLAILNKAWKEWEWIDSAPSVKRFAEAKRRIRYLNEEEAVRLLQELPDHQRDAVTFALATGLRQGNVKRLEWADVNLEKKICIVHPDQAKAGKAIGIPLNDMAVNVLRKQLGKHNKYVFTYRGSPMANLNTRAWTKGLEAAGISDFRWHDLRHTWASWLIQGDVPAFVVQELGGWSSSAMVRRYAALAPQHMAPHAAVIDRKLSHISVTPQKAPD